MADKVAVVHTGENSPEHVANLLMHDIAKVEAILLYRSSERGGGEIATRKWILDTYAECLDAVRGNRLYPRPG